MEKFDDYLSLSDKHNLHPNLTIPTSDKHLILYGPSGVGKYTQMLRYVRNFSSNKLKYEKKIQTNTDPVFILKISDIHYEIDCDLLGCNSKTIWNDIYIQISDIIRNKYNEKCGFIVCKNFHLVHNELLEIFYSYLHSSLNIKFIFLMESVSFLPNNILAKCDIIRIPRPSKQQYSDCLHVPIPDTIQNIKNIIHEIPEIDQHKHICNTLVHMIKHPTSQQCATLREELYNILIYDLGVENCIWKIITMLELDTEQQLEGVYATIDFLQYYTNNYRPIYHLEKYIYKLTNIVNKCNKKN
jgi:hypothetical protein